MSSTQDINDISAQMAALDAEAKQINEKFAAYHTEVQDTVKEILVKAGVWDEVHGMELEREDARKVAADKLQVLQAKFNELNVVLQWMKGKVANAAPAQDAAEDVEDAEVPVMTAPEAQAGAVDGDAPIDPAAFAADDVYGKPAEEIKPVAKQAAKAAAKLEVVKPVEPKASAKRPQAPKF